MVRGRGHVWACALLAAVLVEPQAVTHAASRPRLLQSVELRVLAPPIPVTVAGHTRLAYELHVGNPRAFAVVVSRVEIFDAARGMRLDALEGAGLAARLGRPGLPLDVADKLTIGPGLSAVVYFWLDLDGRPLPTALRHRVELTLRRPTGDEHISLDGCVTPVRNETPLVLSPPLRGGPWVALYDPLLVGGHRTTLYTLDGAMRIPGRFAIDWQKLGDDGSLVHGDSSRVASWHGYGAPVLAVADATVAAAMDDVAEDSPIGAGAPPVPLENASGNYVSLDLGGGRFAFYEHLRPGSVRVKPGERVKRGDVIAELGNSGSSSAGPHLHFHVADGAAELGAEGVPYAITGFDVAGAYGDIDAAASGRPWSSPPPGEGGARRDELPAPNVVVRFRP
jgi:peptidase M23-like protein